MIYCRYTTKHHELHLKEILEEELIFNPYPPVYLLRSLIVILHARFANQPFYFCLLPNLKSESELLVDQATRMTEDPQMIYK